MPIPYQSKYGQTILFESEILLSLTDEELQEIEDKYANTDTDVISYCRYTDFSEESTLDRPKIKKGFNED